jgi:hypothetical protein
MRITKKYAGASCLGRRVFRDRVHPTIAEIQLAKAELDHLEQRFRLRVEQGYSAIPVPSPADIMQAMAQQVSAVMLSDPVATQNQLQSLLLGLAAVQTANNLQVNAVMPTPVPWGIPAFGMVTTAAPLAAAPSVASTPTPSQLVAAPLAMSPATTVSFAAPASQIILPNAPGPAIGMQ